MLHAATRCTQLLQLRRKAAATASRGLRTINRDSMQSRPILPRQHQTAAVYAATLDQGQTLLDRHTDRVKMLFFFSFLLDHENNNQIIDMCRHIHPEARTLINIYTRTSNTTSITARSGRSTRFFPLAGCGRFSSSAVSLVSPQVRCLPRLRLRPAQRCWVYDEKSSKAGQSAA